MSQVGATQPVARYERPLRAGRSRAFQDASRHSQRVRRLKRFIVFASGAAVIGLVGVTLLDPFRKLPEGVSVGQTKLEGTRITMELPKLSGFRKDGRAYEVRAASGVQDIKTPKVIELKEIDARVSIAATDSVNASAPIGIFDSGRDFLQLRSGDRAGAVRIVSTTGYEIKLTNADVDFREGIVHSNEPVAVRMPNGSLSADRFSMADNGHVVTFEGNVTSEIWQDKSDIAPLAPEAKP